MVWRCDWCDDNAEVVDFMIPILYGSDETEFVTMGIGPLTDCISCEVEEERNGTYELTMKYPVNGEYFDEIAERMIICAIPSPYREAQPFRIYKISRPISGNVTVYARHISYDLAGIPVMPFTDPGIATAMNAIKTNSAGENPFTFWTDMTSDIEFNLQVPTAARTCLGGMTGSIIDLYGGEYEWDGYTVKLYSQRGNDNGVSIRYGKNMTALDQDSDVGDTITGILPYWQNENVLVTCNPPIVYMENPPYEKSIPVDFSMEFETQPTQAQLLAEAKDYIASHEIGIPSISTEVSFVHLDQMSGYEGLAVLEACDLCDTVIVQYEKLGVNAKAKIVKIRTDVLLEKYISVQVGTIKANVAQTIADQQEKIEDVIRPDGTVIAEKVAGFINGAVASLVAQYNAATKSDVMAILFENLDETSDLYGALGIGTQGIMISKTRNADDTGWDWTTAITANGMIANIIVAGILSDKLGRNYWNLDTGEFVTTQGEIGGWNINSQAIYKDITASDGTIYRVYFQPPIQSNPDKTWVLSCQKSTNNGQSFTGTFVLYSDGSAKFGNTTIDTDGFVTISVGNKIVSINDGGVSIKNGNNVVAAIRADVNGTYGEVVANNAQFTDNASGIFQTSDGKTVTISNGIVKTIN